MSNISVIGAGAWGTTLAILAAENGHSVTIWSFEEDVAKNINELRENKKYLKGFQLPSGIDATNDIIKAAANEVLIIATPSQYLRKTLKSMAKHVKKDAVIISAVKGIEIETQKRMSEVIFEEFHCENFAVISGPNISKEVAKGLPAAAVSASKNINTAKFVQKILNNGRFRVYVNTDVTGVELGGALKNIIAIAAGVADGLMFGNNAKSALMVRGMAEIIRLGTAMGGKAETFNGLSGIGDLITTCSSTLSRNHHVGMEIAQGKHFNDILTKMYDVAEGVPTSKAAREISRKLKIEMPITEEVYAVIYEDKDPFKAFSSLMQREMKEE